jgi:alpha-glucosidase (family GH31 glycosyl hydrolase)
LPDHFRTVGDRRLGFRATRHRLARHPSLEDPLPGRWDAGGLRLDGWWSVEDIPPIAESGDGVTAIRLEVPGATAVGARLERRSGERFFGFGIRSDAVERTSGIVECWVGEGPYQLDEYPLVGAITPRWALRQRRDAAYYPVPWALSSHGLGLLVDSPEMSWFELGEEISIEVLSPVLQLRVFAGASQAEVLRRFTEETGRQPYPAAPWFFGPWCQTGHADLVPLEKERRIIDTLLDSGAPLSAVETHMRRLPGGAHEGRRDAERKRTALFHARDLASLTYLNPFVSVEYAKRFDEAAPLLQKTNDLRPFVYPAYAGGREPPVTAEGQLDFRLPQAVAFFAELAREALEDGHDGWMEDFGEYTPPDALAEHNLYPVGFHYAGAMAAAEIAPGRPVARFVRSGWTGAAPHAPLVWGGDPTTCWGFDGLASALTQGLSAGLSGIAFWGSDIGGFFTLGEEELDAELLIRWIQLGACCPLMRTKAEGVSIPDRTRPQIWDPEILPHWRRWARFHTQLSPYLLAAAREYTESGMPLMRHMSLVDGQCRRSDQYLLGPDLLVAPVLSPGVLEREVEVPRGRWVDLWRSAVYDDATGALIMRAPRILDGPAATTIAAPLDEIPILVRLGARIPMLSPSIRTLAAPHEDLEPHWLEFAEP